MSQTVIQQRLYNQSGEAIKKLSNKICNLTVVVADEQSKTWQSVDQANRNQIKQNFIIEVCLPSVTISSTYQSRISSRVRMNK